MDAEGAPSPSIMGIELVRLDLSTRTVNCFRREQITTVGELTALTAANILSWQFAGKKTLQEIRSLLGLLGLSLVGDPQLFSAMDVKMLDKIISPPITPPKQQRMICLREASPDVQKRLASRLRGLSLSVRASNVTINAKLVYVGDLAQLSHGDLFRFQNSGRRTVQELTDLLNKQGFELGTSIPDWSWEAAANIEKLFAVEMAKEAKDKRMICLREASPDVQKRLASRLRGFSLSVRARNVTLNAKLIYVGDLVQLSHGDLFRFKNSGKRTVKELTDLLNKQGFEWGTSIPDWSWEAATNIENLFAVEMAREAKDKSNEFLANFGPQPTFIEDELLRIAQTLAKGRNLRLLMDLWGWNGSEPRTLESVGNEFALTRERVRQIAARALRQLRDFKFDTPCLRMAVSVLNREMPASTSQLKKALQNTKVARTDFGIGGLRLAAKFLNVRWPFAYVTLGNERILITAASRDHLAKVRLVIRRRSSELGCVNVLSLLAETQSDESQSQTIRKFLDLLPRVEWLDESKDWLYLRTARNRLLNLCSKVFGVCPRIRTSELRRAVARSRRLPMAPPHKILAAFVERTGLGRIEGENLVANSGMGTLLTHESAEGIMVRVLDEYGPAMDGEDFAEKCTAAGMNATTFYIYRMISSVVCALGKGIYCKVGTPVPPGTIEEIISRRRSAPRVSDYGWTSKGRLWFGTDVSRIVITTGAILLPSFVADFVQGEWRVLLPDGVDYGTVACKDSFVWSFRKQFVLLGAEPDDLVAFEFDSKSRQVIVRVGGPGLFETIQEPDDFDTAEADSDS